MNSLNWSYQGNYCHKREDVVSGLDPDNRHVQKLLSVQIFHECQLSLVLVNILHT
jgi:hypothetical protein